jgi:aerotaxis receptor
MALIASAKERPFGAEELFVFTTDSGGRLRLADAVFARLTGYAAAELAGHTHELLRHPEMPRSLLSEVLSGAAYVRHVGKDGGHFWALLAVTPVADGHVGVGFKPAGPLFDELRERHASLRAAELAGEPIHEQARYAAFVRAAFVADVRTRGPRSWRRNGLAGGVSGAPAIAVDALEWLGDLTRRLERDGELSAALRRRSGSVEALAESIRLFSLNAILAAHRVPDAAAIGAVAGLLQRCSEQAGPDILTLGAEIQRVAARLGDAEFWTAVGCVQAEALAGRAQDAPELRPLAEALATTLETVGSAVVDLDASVDRFTEASRAVGEHLKTLRFLELQGRIEAARSNDTEHVRGLFEEIGAQVRKAGEELMAFSALATRRDRDGADVARESRRQASALRT